MDSLQKRVKRNNLLLFFGSLAMVIFYVLAVKFNVSLSRVMVGEKLPKLEYSELINGPPASLKGKVAFVFFWRPSVKISEKILEWAIEWDEKYRAGGLVIIAITSQSEGEIVNVDGVKELAQKRGIKFQVAVSRDDSNRKKFYNGSLANYYITNRFGVIEVVGDATDGKEEALEQIRKLY